MPVDPRQFEVKDIMDTLVPLAIRRNYDQMKAQGETHGVTSREHRLWKAQYPMVGENRSMIAGTGFKPPEWSPKHIEFKREKKRIRRRK